MGDDWEEANVRTTAPSSKRCCRCWWAGDRAEKGSSCTTSFALKHFFAISLTLLLPDNAIGLSRIQFARRNHSVWLLSANFVFVHTLSVRLIMIRDMFGEINWKRLTGFSYLAQHSYLSPFYSSHCHDLEMKNMSTNRTGCVNNGTIHEEKGIFSSFLGFFFFFSTQWIVMKKRSFFTIPMIIVLSCKFTIYGKKRTRWKGFFVNSCPNVNVNRSSVPILWPPL